VAPTYPIATTGTGSINIFDPNLQVPYSDSWTVGYQRAVGRRSAVEVRYIGTRNRENWRAYNYNELNILENGFLDEFKLAMANLQANIAAGRGNTFAYTGAAGTAPLPIFLAYYNAQPTANAGNAALYTGGNWTNATFLGFLASRNPNPFGFASTNGTNGLQGNATFRTQALTAGIPANYFIVNPETNGGANIVSNLNKTKYHALQLELRRRYAQGLQFQTSYTYGHEFDTNFFSFRKDLVYIRPSGNSGDIPHSFKANVVYDLPFGRGRHWGGSVNGVLDRVIGGWQLGVFSRLQSGTPVNLGNVRLVGMNEKDVQNFFKLRFDDAGKQVYMLPDDVV